MGPTKLKMARSAAREPFPRALPGKSHPQELPCHGVAEGDLCGRSHRRIRTPPPQAGRRSASEGGIEASSQFGGDQWIGENRAKVVFGIDIIEFLELDPRRLELSSRCLVAARVSELDHGTSDEQIDSRPPFAPPANSRRRTPGPAPRGASSSASTEAFRCSTRRRRAVRPDDDHAIVAFAETSIKGIAHPDAEIGRLAALPTGEFEALDPVRRRRVRQRHHQVEARSSQQRQASVSSRTAYTSAAAPDSPTAAANRVLTRPGTGSRAKTTTGVLHRAIPYHRARVAGGTPRLKSVGKTSIISRARTGMLRVRRAVVRISSGSRRIFPTRRQAAGECQVLHQGDVGESHRRDRRPRAEPQTPGLHRAIARPAIGGREFAATVRRASDAGLGALGVRCASGNTRARSKGPQGRGRTRPDHPEGKTAVRVEKKQHVASRRGRSPVELSTPSRRSFDNRCASGCGQIAVSDRCSRHPTPRPSTPPSNADRRRRQRLDAVALRSRVGMTTVRFGMRVGFYPGNRLSCSGHGTHRLTRRDSVRRPPLHLQGGAVRGGGHTPQAGRRPDPRLQERVPPPADEARRPRTARLLGPVARPTSCATPTEPVTGRWTDCASAAPARARTCGHCRSSSKTTSSTSTLRRSAAFSRCDNRKGTT